MKFNKAIYKSEALLADYQESLDNRSLSNFKRMSNNIMTKGYLSNIKYLYIYQKLKSYETLPDWYVQLAKQKLNQLERYFDSSFEEILEKLKLETRELNRFLTQRVAWIYKGKFRVYPMTPIDYLPLGLRLKVYVFLYQNEDDSKARCHLRNRIALTLAKLGHVELAKLYSVYNWLMAQEVMNTHFAKSRHLKETLHHYHYDVQYMKRLAKDEKEVTLLTELVYYYTQLLHPNKMAYNRISVATVDLVAFYYEQYPRLEELSLPIKTYLRTKDKKEFYENVAQKRMKFIREVASFSYNLKEATLTPMNQDQLAIYNYLLRIIE